MAATLVRRKPKYGRKGVKQARGINDMTGVRVGSLSVTKFVGFIGHFSAFECACDCGGKTVVRGPFIAQAAKGNSVYLRRMHCGCKNTNTGRSLEDGYSYWKNRNDRLCERWQQSFELFKTECFALRSRKAPHLVSTDGKPIGPENFLWAANTQAGLNTKQRVAEYLAATRGMTIEAALEHAGKLTRERLRHLSNKAAGVCWRCGGELGKYRSECDDCHHRDYMRAHPMAKVVDGIPEIPNRTSYPFAEWFDGSTWELEPGTDFACSIPSFRGTAWVHARKYGKTLITRIRNGKLYLKAIHFEPTP